MKIRLAILAAVLCISGLCMGTIVYPPVKYGQQVTIYFSIYDSNSPWQFYETAPAADDVSVRKDGGTRARATNSITDLDHVMSLVLTATEMQAAVVTVDVNDETVPPLFGSETIIIPTFGHSSALQAFDLDDANPSVDVNAWSLDPQTQATIFSDPFDEDAYLLRVKALFPQLADGNDPNSVYLSEIEDVNDALDERMPTNFSLLVIDANGTVDANAVAWDENTLGELYTTTDAEDAAEAGAGAAIETYNLDGIAATLGTPIDTDLATDINNVSDAIADVNDGSVFNAEMPSNPDPDSIWGWLKKLFAGLP